MPIRCLRIGVVVAAVFWEILQLFGGLYINHVLSHASRTYAQFALVIALLVWLHLGAQVTLYAAEINVVVARKLWPRSLIGPPDAARRRADPAALAKVEERQRRSSRSTSSFDHSEESEARERPSAGSRD